MKDKEVKESMQSDHTMDLPKRDKGKKVWMIIAIISLLALIGLSIYGYKKIQDQNRKISDQQSQIDELSNQKKSLEDVAVAAAKAVNNATTGTDDDQVVATVKSYCEVSLDSTTNKANVFSFGKFSQTNNKVIYADNKTFAQVIGVCAPTATSADSGTPYILKKANGVWTVVLVSPIEDPAATKKYGIPQASSFK